MKRNMGFADRVLRILAAMVLIILSFTKFDTGIVSTVLLVVAGVFIITSIFGVCPLYSLLGINSCRRSQAGSR